MHRCNRQEKSPELFRGFFYIKSENSLNFSFQLIEYVVLLTVYRHTGWRILL